MITQKTNGIRMRSISVLSFILLSFCIIIGCQKKISTTPITTPEVFFNQKPVCQDFADQDRKNMTTDDKGLRFDVEMVKATDVGIKHKGKQLLVLGTAENAHAGAILNGIYLKDVKSWPEDLLKRQVYILGTVVVKDIKRFRSEAQPNRKVPTYILSLIHI